MSSQARKRLSPEEYLALERQATTRSEFLDGQMFAMSGASPRHALITANIVTGLNLRLKDRPCYVFSSDLRLHVGSTGLFTYPDVVVACGEMLYRDDRRDTLQNPVVIFEVLSDSTEAYDRGRKFGHYRTIPSLVEYLLVAQDKPHVEQYVRQPDARWLLGELSRTEDIVMLPSLGLSLPLEEVYAKVDGLGSHLPAVAP
jgi:Uma2 family endonuclease